MIANWALIESASADMSPDARKLFLLMVRDSKSMAGGRQVQVTTLARGDASSTDDEGRGSLAESLENITCEDPVAHDTRKAHELAAGV